VNFNKKRQQLELWYYH